MTTQKQFLPRQPSWFLNWQDAWHVLTCQYKALSNIYERHKLESPEFWGRCSARLCVGPQAFALPQLGPSTTENVVTDIFHPSHIRGFPSQICQLPQKQRLILDHRLNHGLSHFGHSDDLLFDGYLWYLLGVEGTTNRRSSRHFLVHFCRVPQRSSRQVVAEALPPQPGAMLETCHVHINVKASVSTAKFMSGPHLHGVLHNSLLFMDDLLDTRRTKCLSRDPGEVNSSIHTKAFTI